MMLISVIIAACIIIVIISSINGIIGQSWRRCGVVHHDVSTIASVGVAVEFVAFVRLDKLKLVNFCCFCCIVIVN